MVPRLQKLIQPVGNFIKMIKAALTWRVFLVYVVITCVASFLFVVFLYTYLYIFDPTRLPSSALRPVVIFWSIIGALLIGGFAVVIFANKNFLSLLGKTRDFVQNSLPSGRIKLVVITASLITALIYPCWQAIAYYSVPPITAIPNTPYSGMIAIDDSLSSNHLGWVATPSHQSACTFTLAGYEVRANNGNSLQFCIANKTNFSDFALQVEMTLMSGEIGGVLFRDRYLLALIGSPYNGFYDISAITKNKYETNLLPSCDPIQQGCPIGESIAQQQTVTITLIARGTSIEIYFDGYRMRTVNNGVSSSGGVGFFTGVAKGQEDAQSDVLFANLRIWTDVS